MIKETLTYTDFEGGEDVEKTVELRFVYTPPAIRLYEQYNPGAKFFRDLNAATAALSKYFKNKSLAATMKEAKVLENIEPEDLEQYADLLPMLTDPDINEFMMKIVPCLYMEVYSGSRLQSEETWETANESLWMMQLINIQFFMKVFGELNSMASAQSRARSKKKEASAESLVQLHSIEPLPSQA